MKPYYEDEQTTIYNGDCREILETLPDDSVDAVVSDPPYGLAFMGKRWDYDVPGVEVWQQCLRVLKPGGHLLAFAGTRTQHRMAVKIEDAGFEIRDMIAWVYGSGFPKSLDVSKAIDKAAGAEREVVGQGVSGSTAGMQALGPSGIKGGIYNITAPATESAKQWSGWGTALKPSWESVTWATKPLPNARERDTIRRNLLQMEARLWLLLNANAVKNSLPSSQSEFAGALDTAQWTAEDCISTKANLCDQMDMSRFELAANISLNTVLSWRNTLGDVCSAMSTSTTATELSTTTDWKTLSCCLLQITPENMLLANSLPGGLSANACNAAKLFNALLASLEATLALSAIGPVTLPEAESFPGVDVKPSLDPVILARKPLSGTVAENVLQHGTGALNVDGCRVGTEERYNPPTTKGATPSMGSFAMCSGSGSTVSGRWPANLIHDGSEEVTGLFPETGPAKQADRGKGIDGATFRHATGSESGIRGHDDSGGSAARFFYTAKADKADRGHGNNHPTVKPQALMRYLVRLVCPPGGVVLDPFGGSGTTAAAARLEQCRSILCELSAEYCDIAVERLRQRVLF